MLNKDIYNQFVNKINTEYWRIMLPYYSKSTVAVLEDVNKINFINLMLRYLKHKAEDPYICKILLSRDCILEELYCNYVAYTMLQFKYEETFDRVFTKYFSQYDYLKNMILEGSE